MTNSDEKTPALIDDFIDATHILDTATERWLRGEIDVEELFEAGLQIASRVREKTVPNLESSDAHVRVHAQTVRVRFFDADRRFSAACSVADELDRDALAAARVEAMRTHEAQLKAEDSWLLPPTPDDPCP